jgi:hypothetical protein
MIDMKFALRSILLLFVLFGFGGVSKAGLLISLDGLENYRENPY